MNKPKPRSKLRLMVGSFYFRVVKNMEWHFAGKKFAKTFDNTPIGEEIFSHQSLLLRPLKNVEMWMQHNKIKNLHMAVKNINGLIIKPGETFSYWSLIGKPTARKGYVPGMFLSNGKVKSGLGGGLCQLSNLIFWMTIHTPLSIIERWRHSYDIFPDANRTQPFGSGATCAYPNIDLQIKNETDATFQLQLQVTDTHLIGHWLSNKPLKLQYKIEERNHMINHEWWGGYTRHNQLFQIAYDSTTKEKITEKLIVENYAIMMYEPLLEE